MVKPPVLSVEHVSSGYGKSLVVDDVSIAVEEKQIVGIIGANGSGKSTLLKTVVGLIKPFSGKIVFEGRETTGVPLDAVNRMGMGYVPQVQNTFPNLSVRENLRIGGYYLSKQKIRERMDDMISIFPELRQYLGTKVEKLSGGERQMVAFARSMMIAPKLLVLDEPTAALAPIVVSKMMEKIRAIRDSGISVVMVEQNARKAIQVADFVYVMLSGRVIAEGTGREIQEDKEIGRKLLGMK
ncbi:MAG TPA: ABC transporter ATP-binding protein [Nitrososphaerales archaeon]|nr:ABC transporter ATP-binding protein [Nitrososphaerales archaeon]